MGSCKVRTEREKENGKAEDNKAKSEDSVVTKRKVERHKNRSEVIP